jgi:hypothetical protein
LCIAETMRKRKRGRPSLGPREAFLIKVRPDATPAVRELAEIRGVGERALRAFQEAYKPGSEDESRRKRAD